MRAIRSHWLEDGARGGHRRLVTGPGDAVVVTAPVYALLYAFVTHDARRVVESPLGEDLRIDLDGLLEGLDANRQLLARLLAQHLPAVPYTPPEATYLAWLDCRTLALEPADRPDGLAVVSDMAATARMFLDRSRVAVSSGHVFGPGGAGHVRLNFATSQEILTEAVTRMGQAVRDLS